jgi:alanine racemase
MQYSEEAKALGSVLKIHIKLDTGMSRLGYLCAGRYFQDGVQNIIRSLRLPNLLFEGIYTHFSVSDEPDPASRDYTLKQFQLFRDVISDVESQSGIRFPIRHCANSGAVISYPETALDMVRPGLLLYGYGDDGTLGLRPAMRLVTTVSTIKYHPSGTFVSYGRRYETTRRTRMGVIAAGYADGLPRLSSNKCCYRIAGKAAPQLGSICMDMCMVDLTDIPEARVGSEVELFGPNNSLLSLSDAAGTIPYEILCSVTKRVPRLYLENSQPAPGR